MADQDFKYIIQDLTNIYLGARSTYEAVSYTHLDVYKRQVIRGLRIVLWALIRRLRISSSINT